MRRFPALSHEALAKWGKYLILAISIVFLFFILQKQVFADYTLTTTPGSQSENTTEEAKEYLCGDEGEICEGIVTENTKTVHISFNIPEGIDEEIMVCLSLNCLIIADQDGKYEEFVDKNDLFDDLKIESTDKANGKIELDLCADGTKNLKTTDGQCADKDYFHGGQIYSVILMTKNTIVDTAVFFVSHYYPDLNIYTGADLSGSPKPKIGDDIFVAISGVTRPTTAKDFKVKRNTYAVGFFKEGDNRLLFLNATIVPPDGVVIPPSQQKFVDPVRIPGKDKDDNILRGEGDYVIRIGEKIDWNGDFKIGGFIYYDIKIKVRDDPSKNKGIKIIPDPLGQDIAGAKSGFKVPRPPCSSNYNVLETGTCPEVKTALGDIRTSPGEFVGSIFEKVLGLAGGLAIILIIFSGYRMIASQGNPEKLEEARQQLVSAIVGLLFLIFSLIILQVIGVDILKLDVLSGGAFGT